MWGLLSSFFSSKNAEGLPRGSRAGVGLFFCLLFFHGAIAQPGSIFSSGRWHKLGVSERGVYKIGTAHLRAMGIAVEGLRPTHLRLYGRAVGGPLPQSNAVFRHHDPQEVPLYVVGGADGRWDEGDYVLFFGNDTAYRHYDPSSDRHTYAKHPYGTMNYYFLTVADAPRLAFEDTCLPCRGA